MGKVLLDYRKTMTADGTLPVMSDCLNDWAYVLLFDAPRMLDVLRMTMMVESPNDKLTP